MILEALSFWLLKSNLQKKGSISFFLVGVLTGVTTLTYSLAERWNKVSCLFVTGFPEEEPLSRYVATAVPGRASSAGLPGVACTGRGRRAGLRRV